jgi:hypothetical protein
MLDRVGCLACTGLSMMMLVGCMGEPVDDGRAGPMTAPPGEVETVTRELKVPDTKFGRGVPGGMYYNGTLFMTYTGTDGRMNVVRRNGTQYPKYTLNRVSAHGSQMIAFQGTAFLVFCEPGGVLRALKTTNPADGTSWQDAGVAVNGSCDADPALVVYGGVLIAFVPKPRNIVQSNYDPGSNSWAEVARFNDTVAASSPSAVKLGEDLLLAWVQWTDGRLFIKRYVAGVGWQGQTIIHNRFYRPHLIAGNTPTPSALLIGSVAAGNIDPDTIQLERFNGEEFTPLGRVSDVTRQRPHGLATSGSFAELAYRGTNNALYVRSTVLPAP